MLIQTFKHHIKVPTLLYKLRKKQACSSKIEIISKIYDPFHINYATQKETTKKWKTKNNNLKFKYIGIYISD